MNSSANDASLRQCWLARHLVTLDGTLRYLWSFAAVVSRRATREVLGYVAPMERQSHDRPPLDEQMLGYGDEEAVRALSAAYRSTTRCVPMHLRHSMVWKKLLKKSNAMDVLG